MWPWDFSYDTVSWNSVIGIILDCGLNETGVRILARARARLFSLIENVQNCPTYRLYPGNKSGINLATYLLLVPKLGMSGAIPSLPLYACMVWTGTTLPLLCNLVVLKMMTLTCCWGITRCSLITTILVYPKAADFCKSRESEVRVRNRTLIAVRRVRSRRVSVVLCHPFARVRTVAAKWMTIQFPGCRQEHTATWYKRLFS